MASMTDTESRPTSRLAGLTPKQIVLYYIRSLASLKITVTLFAMAIFIILAGTLAQEDKDIWDVVSQYFRTAFAWIEFEVFFPESFFPEMADVPGGFYFPGGWLIGALLTINLTAAHITRFRPQAHGAQLLAGYGVFALGWLATALVVFGTTNSEGFEAVPWFNWDILWMATKVVLGLVSVGWAWWASTFTADKWIERWCLRALSVVQGALTAWLFLGGQALQLDDSSMRILWQLIQGTLCGLILLVGTNMIYGKRGGVVLIHMGVALVMFSELLVGLQAKEMQMWIWKGQSTNFASDSRVLELAFVNHDDPKLEDVTVIPQALLKPEARLSHPKLPCDVRVDHFYVNMKRVPLGDKVTPASPQGAGKGFGVEELSPVSGVGEESNSPAITVTLLEKGTEKSIGQWFLSAEVPLIEQPESVTIGDKKYDLSLRYERNYKPFTVSLLDARNDKYIGTATTKNFSSEIKLQDPTRNLDRDLKIWMNNPLRFGGETFYQQKIDMNAKEPQWTTLQVVRNTGWMIPYVSCMIVAVGMCFHFVQILVRFLNRVATQPLASTVVNAKQQAMQAASAMSVEQVLARWGLAVALTVVTLLYFARSAQEPKRVIDVMDLHAFGKLPIVYEGRIKPLDTLARTSMRILSSRETFYEADAFSEDKAVASKAKTLPAIVWLADLIGQKPASFEHHVIRIDNPDIVEFLGLKWREKKYYSLAEVGPSIEKISKEMASIRAVDAKKRSAFQRRVMDLANKIHLVNMLAGSVQVPSGLPDIPDPQELGGKPEQLMPRIRQIMEYLQAFEQRLMEDHPPLMVPVAVEKTATTEASLEWMVLSMPLTKSLIGAKLFGQDISSPALKHWLDILRAYAQDDAKSFNKAVDDYRSWLAQEKIPGLELAKVDYESYYNNFSPFYHSAVMYLVALVVCMISWLIWPQTLNRAVWVMLALIFLMHTYSLWGRIYISGRPPVTNLYSAAVFVGWGSVLLGLILEPIYKIGMGNLLAALAGFLSLMVAQGLTGDGDTFTVLQAVLDTQFWLSTHVITITMGYAATFVAGFLGVFYVMKGVCSPSLTSEQGKSLYRMMYGTLCFALFLSFVGTVLGGLWADDSWGRFWGWDPKENGALIIVLWNALVLHARWENLVKERGMALLAVGGNIVTGWSFFGVNELGIGLHSYGFTEGRLMYLGLFCLAQLVVIGIGSIPVKYWWSYTARTPASKRVA